MTALGGHADVHELHAIRFRGEFFPVGFGLRVAHHLEIVGDIESKLLLGRGDLWRGLRGN